MRALIYALGCNPELTSEPYFIYNTCRSLVDRLNGAVVVTHSRNRRAIEARPLGDAEMVYIDIDYIARPIADFIYARKFGPASGTVLNLPLQFEFERQIWRRLKGRLRDGEFDVVHRLGPISAALPSPIATWSPVPFVIGPVNGGLAYPPQFSDVLQKEGEWLRYVRRAYRFLPYMSSTYSKAAAILAAFDHTIASLPPGNRARVINMTETGADPEMFRFEQKAPSHDPVDFIFVGRLVPFKCADVVVSAFAASDVLRKHRLHIVGDGPERSHIETLVRENGLGDCVTVHGWLSTTEVTRRMLEADVFAFPSIRDSGAGVIAEAMMAGLASVVVDYGPGHHVIDATSGIRVPLGSRQDHVDGFRVAMEQLAADPQRCRSLGDAARHRAVDRFTWSAKGERIREVYDWVTGGRSEKPADLL